MSVTIEVRAGSGGGDAAVFADELVRSFRKYLSRRGVGHTCTRTPGVTRIVADGAVGMIGSLAGVHRIQRIPRNGKGRRHTSTATVAVFTAVEAPEVVLDERDLVVETFTAPGPGGQHKNKNATAVRLRHVPSGMMVTATRERSLARNLAEAKRTLASRLAAAAAAEAHTVNVRAVRSQVASSSRGAKTFTHNTQRGTVVDHVGNRRWRLRDFVAGKFERVG